MIEKTSLSAPSEIVRDALSKPTIFKDEGPLSLEWLPNRLPHRENQLRFLAELFRSVIDKPGTTSPKVLITGDIGTGKTVLTQRFGTDMQRTAKTLKLNLALDEADSLIKAEGSTSLYNLTRIQEERPGRPVRLSLIIILREIKNLEDLDRSTQSTLQRNVIRLDHYTTPQLENILRERSELAFKEATVPEEVMNFVADMATPGGDARYAIELLWRGGKYADTEGAREVKPDHIRAAANSVYPVLRTEYSQHLNLHEKLIVLALARVLERNNSTYATMGDVEIAYRMACEEHKETYRAHTQVWKYVQNLNATGILSSQLSTTGFRGKTTLLGISSAPASAIRRWLESTLSIRA